MIDLLAPPTVANAARRLSSILITLFVARPIRRLSRAADVVREDDAYRIARVVRGDAALVDFARPHMYTIIDRAYIEETGCWARRPRWRR